MKCRDAEFPDHFDGKCFYNPEASPKRGFLDLIKWKLTSRAEPSPGFVSDVEPSKPPARVSGSELRSTLVNHSTVLLQVDGLNILTDPIWSEQASPLSWIGPRRKRDAGVLFGDLPPIDLVLPSHNHYDHLDLPTLRTLSGRGPCTYVVPSGCARLLNKEHLGPVHELDWGDSVELPGVKVSSVPARHFSSRSLLDYNRTLWCGYMLDIAARLIYFARDTAFGAHFEQIRNQFGPPDLAFLPIGAYQPRCFMSPVHMGPDEAVRAHRIVQTKISIAIHHGTFQLADEAIDTPQRELAACAAGEAFRVLRNGEYLTLS